MRNVLLALTLTVSAPIAAQSLPERIGQIAAETTLQTMRTELKQTVCKRAQGLKNKATCQSAIDRWLDIYERQVVTARCVTPDPGSPRSE